jgi:hypothetical protein
MDRAVKHIRHALHGPLSAEIPDRQVVNQAGHFLVSMHPWEWLGDRMAYLNVAGTITLTDATWTVATLTLTKVGAFADYTFIAGDTIEITDGTSTTTGFYEVASKTSDDAIVLTTAISAGDQTDIDATFTQPRIYLPADLRHITAYNTANSLVTGLKLTNLQDLLDRRTSGIVASTWVTFGAVVYRVDTTVTTGNIVRPVLELWPDPATTETRKFTIFYQAGWTEVDDDADILVMPTYVEALYLQIVRAFAKSYEEDEKASLDQRLAEIQMGPMFADAATQDGAMQPTLGPIERGAVQSGFAPLSYFLPNTISGPV